MMRNHRRLHFSLGITLLWMIGGGEVSAQLTISDPDDLGAVRQVSLSTRAAEKLDSTTRDPWQAKSRRGSADLASREPIRVSVQYLRVDKATRAAIYAGLQPDLIQSSTHVPVKQEPQALNATSAKMYCHGQMSGPSRMTTCVLQQAEATSVIQMANDAVGSDVSRAPSVLLLDGKEAELNDLVQRPFAVGFQTEGGMVKPIVDVLDDGKRLRLLARIIDSEQGGRKIQLTAELVVSQILEVKTDEVFGAPTGPMTVQVPTHQVLTSMVGEHLASGQTLLMDPHISNTKMFENQAGIPVLSSIPYVGRSFRNVSTAAVEQHLLVLLQPSVEPSQ